MKLQLTEYAQGLIEHDKRQNPKAARTMVLKQGLRYDLRKLSPDDMIKFYGKGGSALVEEALEQKKSKTTAPVATPPAK